MPVNSFDNYPMSWKPNTKDLTPPLYKSLAQLLENDIQNGTLNPGDKLPPQRELADFLDLNLSTITRAFKICELKGLISGTTGKGTYISSDVQTSPLLLSTLNEDYIDMGAAFPLYEQNKYIIDLIKKLIKKTNIENFLQYSPPIGLLSHRKTACKYLRKFNINATPENIMITSGSQNALSIILMSLFASGDKIGTDPLTYPAFKSLANMLGIRLFPLPINNTSVTYENLDTICKNENIKGLYLIPEMHNPTTYSMSKNQKEKLSKIIKNNNLLLIEDGIYSYLSDSNNIPLSAMAPNHSLYISSLSKSLCAGLRVSFMVVPNKYKSKIEQGIYNVNVTTSSFNVEIACQAIETQLSDKIISERKKLTLERNTIVNRILKNRTVYGNDYSLFRWLVLPKHICGSKFEIRALEKGVQVFCADRFVVGNSKFEPAARLSVCSPKNNEELEHALIIIDNIINEM